MTTDLILRSWLGTRVTRLIATSVTPCHLPKFQASWGRRDETQPVEMPKRHVLSVPGRNIRVGVSKSKYVWNDAHLNHFPKSDFIFFLFTIAPTMNDAVNELSRTKVHSVDRSWYRKCWGMSLWNGRGTWDYFDTRCQKQVLSQSFVRIRRMAPELLETLLITMICIAVAGWYALRRQYIPQSSSWSRMDTVRLPIPCSQLC